MNNKRISKSTLDRMKNAMLRMKKRRKTMGMYLNKTGKFMNLQITRFETIPVKVGVDTYDDEIAKKFPAIFEKIDLKKEVKELNEDNKEVNEDDKVEVIEPEVNEDDKVEVIEPEVDEIPNYDEMGYPELKRLIKQNNLEIDGRISKAKCIEILKANA